MLDLESLETAGDDPRSSPWGTPLPTNAPNERIAEVALERLRACAPLEAGSLQCEFQKGVLVLWGRVDSFYHKQLAQEAVRNLRGVDVVVNTVEVVAGAPTPPCLPGRREA
jgi:hypothetical protein